MLKFLIFIILVSIAYFILDLLGSVIVIVFYILYFIFKSKKNNYLNKAKPYIDTADNIHTAKDIINDVTDIDDISDIADHL